MQAEESLMTRRVRTKKIGQRSRLKQPSEEKLIKLRHMLFGGLRIINHQPPSEPIIFYDTKEMMDAAFEQFQSGGG
jgi:hypothetical protein